MLTFLFLGYAKVIPSKRICPTIFSGIFGFYEFLTKGYLSNTSNILAAAAIPSAIFLMDGESWLKFIAAINTLKKMIKTSPA